MKIVKLICFSFAFISSIHVFAGYAPSLDTSKENYIVSYEYGKQFTYEEVLSIAKPVAYKYNISLERMMYTLEAESHFKNTQSNCYKSETSLCDSSGIREESYGIAQFHVSTLSKEDALNIYKSIDKMGYLFSINEACRWTEYRKKYGCI